MKIPMKNKPQNKHPAPDGAHILGATGRSGLALYRAMQAAGLRPVAVVRDAAKWQRLMPSHPYRVADLNDSNVLQAALADARKIVSCAHARHAPTILAAGPEMANYVFLGSTRKFSQWPDDHGNGVQLGETAFRDSGRSGVMLHPTMIYGAQGEDNVRRLARLLRWLPVVPLPEHGRALVQPIHQEDVTRAILAALKRRWYGPHSLVICGPQPVSYADFVREVALAAGQSEPRIVAMSAKRLMKLARFTRVLPFVPRIRPEEIRRLLEDKAFDPTPMITQLGIRPVPLAQGLAMTFRHR